MFKKKGSIPINETILAGDGMAFAIKAPTQKDQQGYDRQGYFNRKGYGFYSYIKRIDTCSFIITLNMCSN